MPELRGWERDINHCLSLWQNTVNMPWKEERFILAHSVMVIWLHCFSLRWGRLSGCREDSGGQIAMVMWFRATHTGQPRSRKRGMGRARSKQMLPGDPFHDPLTVLKSHLPVLGQPMNYLSPHDPVASQQLESTAVGQTFHTKLYGKHTKLPFFFLFITTGLPSSFSNLFVMIFHF